MKLSKIFGGLGILGAWFLIFWVCLPLFSQWVKLLRSDSTALFVAIFTVVCFVISRVIPKEAD